MNMSNKCEMKGSDHKSLNIIKQTISICVWNEQRLKTKIDNDSFLDCIDMYYVVILNESHAAEGEIFNI
jgi:hypothetical protein